MDFQERLGGHTLRIGQLSSVYVDPHQGWYAIHWTSPFDIGSFLDLLLKELDLPGYTPAFLQYPSADTDTSLDDVRPIVDSHRSDPSEGAPELLRLDLADYILVWEPSVEYRRLSKESPHTPYTAIVGFGSHLFDPKFVGSLISLSGSPEVSELASDFWNDKTLVDLSYSYEHDTIRARETGLANA